MFEEHSDFLKHSLMCQQFRLCANEVDDQYKWTEWNEIFL